MALACTSIYIEPNPFMRLVIPADFTELSKKAAYYGASLAEKLNAELTLVHIHQPPVSKNNPVYPMGADLENDIRKSTGIKLGDFYKEMFNQTSHSFTGVSRTGRTADEIVLEAARQENSMIIMATRRNDGIRQWTSGSRTAEVLEKTDQPVLVIPEDCPARIPERIAFITGCDSYDLFALKSLILLARSLDAEVFLIHISSLSKNGNHQVFKDFVDRVKFESGYEKIYSVAVRQNDVMTGVTEYLKNHQPDLLSFNTRKKIMKRRLLQKSFAEKLSRAAELPMLIFHRP